MATAHPHRRHRTEALVPSKLSQTAMAPGDATWIKQQNRASVVVRTSPPTHRLYREGTRTFAKGVAGALGQRRLPMPMVTDNGTYIERQNVVALERQIIKKPLAANRSPRKSSTKSILVAMLPPEIDPEFEPIMISMPTKMTTTPDSRPSVAGERPQVNRMPGTGRRAVQMPVIGRRAKPPTLRADQTEAVLVAAPKTSLAELASSTRQISVELPVINRRTKIKPVHSDETEIFLVVKPEPPRAAKPPRIAKPVKQSFMAEQRLQNASAANVAKLGGWEWDDSSTDTFGW